MGLQDLRGEDRYRRWWTMALVFLALLWTGGFLLEAILSGSGAYPPWALPVVVFSFVLLYLIDRVFRPNHASEEEQE